MTKPNQKLLSKESKNFSVHPAIIYSIISKQASGVPKALLELAMNSVDAGATQLDIKLTETDFVFADNGRGFKDIEEVESFFGTFGTPHAANDSYYGRYRLGRGQVMTYAKTQWFTKDFCMNVDLNIDPHAIGQDAPLGYSITTDHEYYQGCKIVGQFYKPQVIGNAESISVHNDTTPETLREIIPAFAKMIRYLPIPVFINGVRVNKDINSVVYVENNEDALFALTQKYTHENAPGSKNGIVNVYNKGVYAYQVRSMYFTGDVISHNAIDLNMARNQAKTICSVANAITRKLAQLDQKVNLQKAKRTRKKSSKVDVEVTAFVDDLWKGILGFKPTTLKDVYEAANEKVFVLANDKRVSILEIVKQLKVYYNSAISSCVDLNLYYYNDELINDVLGGSRDVMTVTNGYIPLSLFPSNEVIEALDFDVVLPESLYADYYKPSANEESFRWRERQFEDLIKLFQDHPVHFSKCEGMPDTRYNLLLQYLCALLNLAHSVLKSHDLTYCPYSSRQQFIKDMGGKSNRISIIPELFAKPIRSLICVEVANIKRLEFIQESKLTKFEKSVLMALEYAICSNTAIRTSRCFYDLIANESDGNLITKKSKRYMARELKVLNNSDEPNVLAWTDGYDFIAFNEHYFKQCVQASNFESLMNTAFHEICHITDSKNSTVHGDTFYYAHKVVFIDNFKVCMDEFYDHLSRQVLRKGEKVLETGITLFQLADLMRKKINNFHASA